MPKNFIGFITLPPVAILQKGDVFINQDPGHEFGSGDNPDPCSSHNFGKTIQEAVSNGEWWAYRPVKMKKTMVDKNGKYVSTEWASSKAGYLMSTSKMADLTDGSCPPPIQSQRLKPSKFKAGSEEPPCTERVSVFGNKYPDSKPTEWKGYVGAGWVHDSEARMFSQSYAICCVSKTYHRHSFMTVTAEGLWVNNRELKSGAWEKCSITGHANPAALMVDIFDSDGSKARVSQHAAEHKGFKDDMDHRWYQRHCRVQIRESEKYKYVSNYNVHRSKKFCSCQGCGNNFEIASKVVEMRDDLNQMLCLGCYETMLVKDVIKAHNYTSYPKPVFTAPPKPRITKEALARTLEVMKKLDHPLKDESWEGAQKKTVMLYGIECETEFINPESGPGKRAKLALQAWNALGKDFCIIKHDGSLHGRRDPEAGERIRRGGDYGFEIVSAPCDIATHRERWKRLEQMKDYKELRAWDVGTCGLHIHVSRAPMTALQICRITYMVNNPKLKKFIELVAGRCAARYNKFIPKKLTDGTRPEMDKDKYTAINIKHEHTIEFRIFRGSVNWRRIIRCLEFVEAVVRFCYPGDRSLKELSSWESFVKFAASNRKLWPEFNRWLDIQEEFTKLVLQNPGAFGPKDTRTIAGEKPIPVEEANDPDTPKKPTKVLAKKPLVKESLFEEEETTAAF